MYHPYLYANTWYADACQWLGDEEKEREVARVVVKQNRKEKGRGKKRKKWRQMKKEEEKSIGNMYLGSSGSDSEAAPSYAMMKLQQQQWGSGNGEVATS